MLGAVVYGHEQMQAGDQSDQRAGGRGGQAAVGLVAAAEGRGAGAPGGRAGRGGLAGGAIASGRSSSASEKVEALRKSVMDALVTNAPEPADENMVGTLFSDLESRIVRGRILRRRTAHRRPRHPHRAPDLHPHRRAAQGPRLGAVYARRNPGAGGGHTRHRARRADHRRAAGRVLRAVHAPLQHAALCHRGDRAAWVRPSVARSVTAGWPSERW